MDEDAGVGLGNPEIDEGDPTDSPLRLNDVLAEEVANADAGKTEEPVEAEKPKRGRKTAEKAAEGAAEAVATDGGEKAEADPFEGLTPETLEQLRKDAEFGKKWEERYAADPVLMLKHLAASIDEASRERLYQELGLTAQQREAVEGDEDELFEGLTPQEILVEKSKDWIVKGPEQLQTFASEVVQAISERDMALFNFSVESRQALSLVEAIADAIGLEVPKLDRGKALQELQAGKSLDEVMGEGFLEPLKSAVEKHKQNAKPRPRTPGDTGGPLARTDSSKLRLRDLLVEDF